MNDKRPGLTFASMAFNLLLSLSTLLLHIPLANAAESCLQDNPVGDLTDDERAALEKINEEGVKSTLSWLASDELGGRGTPSPGFRKACEYVNERFKAAGLKGINEDGSYYHTHSLTMVQTPSTGIELKDADSNVLTHLGLIAATASEVKVEGNTMFVEKWNEWTREMEQTGNTWPEILVLAAQDSIPVNAQLRQIRRRAELASQHGTRILLQATAASGDMVSLASRMAATPVWTANGDSWPMPVLLVDAAKIPSGALDITIPGMTATTEEVQNVIGILPGSDPELSKEAIIISAHLDHLGTRENGTDDPIYNGADDNASGVTGVLSLADAYAALPTRPARTMIFATFWGEESGLLGSRELVKRPVWPIDKTLAMINLEMLGRPEPGASGKTWVTGWEQSDLGSQMAIGAQRVGVDIFEHPRYSAMLYRASDNWPFAEAGVIAHSFSAGSLHSDYHQPGDSWEKLETRHMAEVIRGLFAGSLPIAEGKLTPRKAAGR